QKNTEKHRSFLLCSSVSFKATEKHRKAQIILAVFICVLQSHRKTQKNTDHSCCVHLCSSVASSLLCSSVASSLLCSSVARVQRTVMFPGSATRTSGQTLKCRQRGDQYVPDRRQ